MDKLGIKGIINIDVLEQGKVIESHEFENLVTSNGFLYIARMLSGQASGINKIGFGNNSTAAAESDTKLGNRLVFLDVNADLTNIKLLRFYVTIPANLFQTTVSYTEGGLYMKTTNEEILITRAVFPAVFQKPSNSLSVTYTLKLI